MRRSAAVVFVLATMVLAGSATEAGRRCKGTKNFFAGKCRYPDEIRRLKGGKKKPRRRKLNLRWVRITGGSFVMGASSGKFSGKPAHTVRVRSFSILKTEVTVAQYRACVKRGKCRKPDWQEPGNNYNLKTGSSKYYVGFTGDDQPVVGVNWKDAVAFCKFAGGRVPTEAEWEYAARSGGRAWMYPWGNTPATCSRTIMMEQNNRGCGRNRTWPVCSRPAGNTLQGLCDMSGNVWEWTADCWHTSFNGAPTDGSAWTQGCSNANHVYRGGSWYFASGTLRAAARDQYGSSNGSDYHLGIRCAK